MSGEKKERRQHVVSESDFSHLHNDVKEIKQYLNPETGLHSKIQDVSNRVTNVEKSHKNYAKLIWASFLTIMGSVITGIVKYFFSVFGK